MSLTADSAMAQVLSRFFINLPQAELKSFERIFIQLEQAYWFYEDFYCDRNSDLQRFTQKEFCHRVFSQVAALRPHLSRFEELYVQFQEYLARVPVYGCILLDESKTHCVVVRSWQGKNWAFPRGKINRNEDQLDCAIRETYEETGYDARHLVAEGTRPTSIKTKIRHKHVVFFIISGVSHDAVLAPRCRKEISEAKFVALDDINTKRYWSILPILPRLRAMINAQTNVHASNTKRSRSRRAKQQRKQDTKVQKTIPTAILARPSSRRTTNNNVKHVGRGKQNQKQQPSRIWTPEVDQDTFGSSGRGSRRWSAEEMFKVNEQQFGVQNTVPQSEFDRNSPHYPKTIDQAIQIFGNNIRQQAQYLDQSLSSGQQPVHAAVPIPFLTSNNSMTSPTSKESTINKNKKKNNRRRRNNRRAVESNPVSAPQVQEDLPRDEAENLPPPITTTSFPSRPLRTFRFDQASIMSSLLTV
jgi:8-oxo-dGTP pyrophosphatase MutT (NUDIX family)